MLRPILAALVMLSVGLQTKQAAAASETIRDANGRIIGNRETMPSGDVWIRDGRGRIVGNESTSPSGTVTMRDSRGRIIGTRQRSQ